MGIVSHHSIALLRELNFSADQMFKIVFFVSVIYCLTYHYIIIHFKASLLISIFVTCDISQGKVFFFFNFYESYLLYHFNV
jgi:hypothetical protein